MAISKIIDQRLNRPVESVLVLRNGQIVVGKVNKIYPDNRAEIQLGKHRLIAEITTPLRVGEAYTFQVNKQGEDLIQLRVISTYGNVKEQENVSQLLNNLQLPINRTTLTFVQALIDEQIPFSRQQLIDAFRLLEQFSLNNQNLLLLKAMIAERIPLTESIFQAKVTYDGNSLSNVLKQVLEQLNLLQDKTATEVKLQALLTNLLTRTSEQQWNNLSLTQINELTKTLVELKLINPANLQTLLIRRQNVTPLLQSLIEQLAKNSTNENVREQLMHLLQQSSVLKRSATELIQQFNLTSSERLTDRQFTTLVDKINQRIVPLLHGELKASLQAILRGANQEAKQNVYALLQTLAKNETYTLTLESLQLSSTNQPANESLVKMQFLIHVQQFLQSIGIGDEALIKQALLNNEMAQFYLAQNESIKGLIIKAMQESSRLFEPLQQVLHYINGMQLESKETNQLLNIQYFIPGEKIGLPSDLFMQFEGKESKDGNIDADFCRILFFLTLKNLDDTIIDMHVQKRVVTLTIYNEFNEKIARTAGPLKGQLKDALAKINYQLSTIRWKPLTEREVRPNNNQISHQHAIGEKGIDFII